MDLLTFRVVELLLLPPGNLLLFLGMALWWYRRKGVVISLLVAALLQVVVLSLPVVATRLFNSLATRYPPQAELWQQQPLPQAIVVLGGERSSAVEYGGITSSSMEMERLSYAAYLHRQTGLPILLSGMGGNGLRDQQHLEGVMQRILQLPVKWVENRSTTTWENAVQTDALLTDAGIRRAWVVTHAWHMPRALYAFQDRRVEYLPASVTFGANLYLQHTGARWIPQTNALVRSSIALHEWLGLYWYQYTSLAAK